MVVRNQITKAGASIGINYRVPKKAGISRDYKKN